MKLIKLERMELRNFKGVASADYTFNEETAIVGGNATGKSTIYEAYLWCLFDKNATGKSPKVQPLDEHNEVKHKLTTSVKLHLVIDGSRMIVERTLQEDWSKPRGTAEMVLKGTKSEYAINEVPLSLTQYNSKLAEIMPIDKWFLISCVGIIPGMDQKSLRAELQAIAPTIDDKQLAAGYPAVLDAIKKNLAIEELAALNKKMKSDAKQELDSIPAALDAQDRLRVDDDFESLEQQLNRTNADIAMMQAELESLQTGIENDEVVKELNWCTNALAEIRAFTERKRNEEYNKITSEIQLAESEVRAIQARVQTCKNMATGYQNDIDRYKKQIADYREQWIAKNAEVYAEPAINNTCPTCGQPLPAERIEEAKARSLNEWNMRKRDALAQIQHDAEGVKERVSYIEKDAAKNAEEMELEAKRLEELNKKVCDLDAQRLALPTVEERLAASKDYQDGIVRKAELEEQIQAGKNKDNEVKIAEAKATLAIITNSRDELIKKLAERDANKRIDEERARLEEQQRTLADVIAQCEGVEAQIAGFRKARINAVEEGVSSLFTFVRWKMYEPNVTNDGEKEICQAVIAGVPYDQQNNAMRINAGIDIANAFARAYGVSAPLFIDNAESVTNPIPATGQRITLSVVANSELIFA